MSRKGLKAPSHRTRTLFDRLFGCAAGQISTSPSEMVTDRTRIVSTNLVIANALASSKNFASVVVSVPDGNKKTHVFTVNTRYKVIEFLGEGAQGATVTAVDKSTNEIVVIKRINLHFDNPPSAATEEEVTKHKRRCERIMQVTTREIELLRVLDHPNLLHLIDIFTPNVDASGLKEIYHVTPFRGATLTQRRQEKKRFSHEMVSFIVYQILAAIQYLHRLGVIHRDLKTSNIAVDVNMHVTVLDMGWSRRLDPDSRLTTRAGTLIYDAPEMLCKMKYPYDNRVDIWAVGCIMGELIRLETVLKGKTVDEIYSKMTKTFQPPRESNFYDMFVDADRKKMIERKERREKEAKQLKPFSELFADSFFEDKQGAEMFTGNNARSFLERMLAFDYRKRAFVDECINHPYVKSWAHQESAVSEETRRIVCTYDISLEHETRSTASWKGHVFNFIKQFQDSASVVT